MSGEHSSAALMTNLENFVEVARVGNVSRAANNLFISQPALTARLHALEAELGARLFVRTRQGMRLTEAGKAFLPHAERALRAASEGMHAVEQSRLGVATSLTVGVTPSVSVTVLPAALMRVRESFPSTRLAVRTGHSEQIVDLVLREEVELGVVRELRHADLQNLPLFDDELVMVVAPAHPFASPGRIEIADLGAEQLVLFDRTSSYHELTSALFRGAGVTPRSVLELDNIVAARRMVEEGLGVALLPMSAVTNELAAGLLVHVQLANSPTVRRRYVAIRRRNGLPLNEREELFINAVRTLGSAVRVETGSVEGDRVGAVRRARRRPSASRA